MCFSYNYLAIFVNRILRFFHSLTLATIITDDTQTMKILTTILSLILLISCGQQENKTNQATTEKVENLTTDTSQTKITFYKVNGKGILLGDNLKLLDGNFKEIKDISYLNEQFVDITEVSDKYHKIKQTDDYCQEFKYVKIKTKEFEGYVDGRKIYAPIKHTQNKIVKIDNKEVSFIATTYFGIGVSDDDGLTGCSINTPVVFTDKSVNYVRTCKNGQEQKLRRQLSIL